MPQALPDKTDSVPNSPLAAYRLATANATACTVPPDGYQRLRELAAAYGVLRETFGTELH